MVSVDVKHHVYLLTYLYTQLLSSELLNYLPPVNIRVKTFAAVPLRGLARVLACLLYLVWFYAKVLLLATGVAQPTSSGSSNAGLSRCTDGQERVVVAADGASATGGRVSLPGLEYSARCGGEACRAD